MILRKFYCHSHFQNLKPDFPIPFLTLFLYQVPFPEREALGKIESEFFPPPNQELGENQINKQTQSYPQFYPLSRNSTMTHSAGGGPFPAFPSLTQLKSHHSQREIKDRVRKRDYGFCLQDEKAANQFSPPTCLPILKH